MNQVINIMKKKFSFLYCCLLVSSISAQDFTMTVKFEDAAGNLDSVITGASPNASIEYDISYDSTDLARIARREGVDVRLSSRIYPNERIYDNFNFYSSKGNIIPYSTAIALEVSTSNWPITVSWSSKGLNTKPLDYSLLTRFPPGVWGDFDLNEINLSSNNGELLKGEATIDRHPGVLVENGDTITWFWLSFEASPLISTTIPSNLELKIHPNPVNDVMFINGEIITQLVGAELVSMSGQVLQRYSHISDSLVLPKLAHGTYLMHFLGKTGRRWIIQFVKY